MTANPMEIFPTKEPIPPKSLKTEEEIISAIKTFPIISCPFTEYYWECVETKLPESFQLKQRKLGNVNYLDLALPNLKFPVNVAGITPAMSCAVKQLTGVLSPQESSELLVWGEVILAKFLHERILLDRTEGAPSFIHFTPPMDHGPNDWANFNRYKASIYALVKFGAEGRKNNSPHHNNYNAYMLLLGGNKDYRTQCKKRNVNMNIDHVLF